MSANSRRGRFLLWIGAVLLFMITPVIGAGVLPVIGTFTSPYARLESTVIFLWACAGFSCLAALILALIAACVRRLDGFSGFLLCAVMLVALLFSFVLSNAAFDLQARGPALQLPAILLHLCSAADFAIALSILIATILLPKRRANDPPTHGAIIIGPPV